jgi:hypothetical protein
VLFRAPAQPQPGGRRGGMPGLIDNVLCGADGWDPSQSLP